MGAASEIGKAIALAFADAGADVALTSATPDAEEAFAVQRLARSIGGKGRRSMAEAVDMSLGANVQVAVRQIAKELGGIDVLAVAAAELNLGKASERLTDAEWARLLNINLSAWFFACRGVAREMMAGEPAAGREADRGRIIVVSTAQRGEDGAVSAAYAATKAGVEGLVEALAAEWRDRIAVNRLVAEPAALDAASERALWLASEAATGKTGEVYRVPGG